MCSFLKNTVVYFNFIYVCYDQNAEFFSLILIFSTLCVVCNLIQRKSSRRRPFTY